MDDGSASSSMVGARVASADLRVPACLPGMRIGLFGGSFNPPHLGHLHVARTALARLGLDRLWVMVTPGNPLKDRADLPDLARRVAATKRLMDDPRITVTAFEAAYGSPYSWRTVDRLVRSHPGVHFVWVMGGDNLAGFHRWQYWRRIAATLPIAVVDRPEASLAPLRSLAARALAPWRRPEYDAPVLALEKAPAWTFLHAPRVDLSSTELRRRGLGL